MRKKRKYLTLTVPCYNSQDYMERCVDSLLEGGEDVEILLVDDGSTDRTAAIADGYAERFPDIVRVIHQENGGHGSGVNAGISNASGEYFKVVDSDDWLDREAFRKLLTALKRFCTGSEKGGSVPDLIVCNYIYDHLEEKTTRLMRYKNVFPEETMCGWNEIGHFLPSQYLIMHALVYRTQILKDCGIRLPEHTFYVDNIFACQPLPLVKNIFYMNVDLYHYYLGREDQSVNETVFMKRIDQQIYVTKLVSRCVDLEKVRMEYPRLAAYLCRNISIMMAISSIHLLLIDSAEAYQKRQQLWQDVKAHDRFLYYRLRYATLSGLTCLPGRAGGKLTVGGYRIARKIWQFQ